MKGLPDFIPQSLPVDTHAGNMPAAAFDPQLPPPYRFESVGTRMFPLLADRARLKAICQHFFNDIAEANSLPFTIEPIQSLVLLEILSYPRMYSSAPEYKKFGYSTQNELLFAIPVAYWSRGDSATPLAVGLFVPYLFVDNDWSEISGRGIAGFPKAGGQFRLPPQFSSAFPTDIKARVLSPFNESTESEFATLLEIGEKQDSITEVAIPPGDPALALTALEPETVWPYGPIERLYGAAAERGLAPVSDDIYQLLLKSAGVRAANYSLKQFRNGINPAKADYQGIVECEMELTHFAQPGVFTNTEIKLHDYASHRIAATLGLEVQDGILDPIMQMRFRTDVNFKVKRSLYTRCGEQTSTSRPRSCSRLLVESANLTGRLVKQQLSVTRSLGKTLARGRLHPRHFKKDIGTAAANIVRYGKDLSRLTLGA